MNFTLLCKINLTFIDQTLFIERHWEDNDDDNDENGNEWNWIVFMYDAIDRWKNPWAEKEHWVVWGEMI